MMRERWAALFRSQCFTGVWCGLLRCVRAGRGFRLSRHVLEEQFELGGVDLLAFAAEETADQVVELGFEKGDLRVGSPQSHDPCGRWFASGVSMRVDTARNAPTARFTLL